MIYLAVDCVTHKATYSRLAALLCLLLSFVSFHATAQNNVIGRVITTSGTVVAIDEDNNTRELLRRSNIFLGDTVVTGPQGFAQIRMRDSAMLALKEETEYKFKEFEFDGNSATPDSVVMEMVRGGFRTITGSIGDSENDTYRVETAFAYIGVRGTSHKAVIAFGSLFTGVSDGGTTVTNELGSIDTGVGGDFDYAETTQGQAPQGLLQQPNQLGQIAIVTVNLDDEDDDTGGNDNGDDNNGGDNNNAAGGGDNNGGDNNAGGGNNDGANNNAGGGNQGGGDNTPPNFDNLGGDNQGGGNNFATPQAGGTGTPNTQVGVTNTGNTGGDAGGATTPAPGGNTDQAINPLQNVRSPSNITNPGETVVDTDGDGVPDTEDAFPNNPAESRDTDGDGVGDNADAFPLDPAESADSDGDGVGDFADAFPEDPLEFLDSDGDGFGNNSDAFPNDPLENLDSDNDGVGDNSDPAPNDPSIPGDGTDGTGGDGADGTGGDGTGGDGTGGDGTGGEDGTPADIDTDGDGVIDSEDAFPLDENEQFDTDGDGVGDNADQFPNDPSRFQIVAVLTPTQIANIENGLRRGFTLSGNFPATVDGVSYPAILYGDSNDASGGYPILILEGSQVADNGTILFPETETTIFKTSGTVNNSALGFTSSLTSYNGLKTFDVQWGLWGPGQFLRSYTNPADDTVFSNIGFDMIWASTLPTDLAEFTGQAHYWGMDNFLGGSNNAGALTDFFATFDVDFGSSTNNVTGGFMEFCLGGGSNGCDENSGAEEWELEFTGELQGDMLLAGPNYVVINDTVVSSDVTGVISGLFTTEQADGFLGGISLRYNEYMGDTTLVDAVFLLERETRFSNSELLALEDLDASALLVQPLDARTLTGIGLTTGTNESEVLFIDTLNRNVIRNNNITIDLSDAGLISNSYGDEFGVSWERWQGTTALYDNNFDNSSPVVSNSTVAYYTVFDDSRLNNLRGTFNQPLAFIGEDENGTQLDQSHLGTFRFDVDLFTGTVSDGQIVVSFTNEAGTPELETWTAFFKGALPQSEGAPWEFQFDPAGGSNQIQIGSATSNPANFEGVIRGGFVDNGTDSTAADEIAFVTSFFFKDNSSDPTFNTQFVTGTGLIGGSSEVRFDATAEADMSRMGLVMPTIEDTVYGAFATTEQYTPIFADNSTAVGSYPFVFPNPEQISFVFLTKGGTAASTLDVGGHDVTLGYWTPGETGGPVRLTSNVDINQGVNYGNDVYWATVPGVAPLTDPFPDNALFSFQAPDDITYLGDSSEGPLKGLKTSFQMDSTGNITGGTISVCAGGSGSGCSDDSTGYKITFHGSTQNGVFSGTVDSLYVEAPGQSPAAMSVTGELEGLFTAIATEEYGDSDPSNDDQLYDAFVGSFNLGDSSDSTKYLTGTFVVEREDRYSLTELNDLDKVAVVARNSTGATGIFRATSSAGTSMVLVSRDPAGAVVRYDGTPSEVTTQTPATLVTNPDGYAVSFARWDNALVAEDNLIWGNNAADFTNEASPMWWAHASAATPPGNLTGTYRTSLSNETELYNLGFEGAIGDPFGSAQQTLSFLDLEFDVNLLTGNISNGQFYAETGISGQNTWTLHGFSGQIEDSLLKFDFVDQGSNDLGVYNLNDPTEQVITSADLSGIFINKTSPNFDGEGVVGAFALRTGTLFLDGVYLAGLDEYSFLDLRLDGVSAAESDPANPLYNGMLLIGDWHDNSSYSKIYRSIVANPDTSPVFMASWDGIPYSVFKQDSATGANTFPLTSTYPGVRWGMWEKQPSQYGPALYPNTDGTGAVEFDFLPWLVVDALNPDTQITSYSEGTINYGFTRAFNTRNSWGGNLSALNVSLGLDFTYGSITDGTINLCFGGSGCGSADEAWHGHFSASPGSVILTDSPDLGVIPLLSVNGSFENTNGSTGSFNGDIGGFLTGFKDASSPYDALAGGFNLTTGTSDRSISGTFLSEQESRLSALDMNYVDAFVRGAVLKPDGTIITGLMGTHSASYPSEVFFIDESTANNTVWTLGPYNDAQMIQYYADTGAGGHSFDAGIWNAPATLLTDNTDDSVFTTVSGGPIAWLNYEPVDFLGLTFTRFSTSGGSPKLHLESASPGWNTFTPEQLGTFDFHFDTDLSTGVIQDSKLTASKSVTINSTTYEFKWMLEFTPNNDIQDGVGFFDLNDFSNGSLEISDGVNSPITVAVNAAILSGSFSADPVDTNNLAHVGGSLLLEANVNLEGFDIDASILGDYEILGYWDNRITRNELLGMEDNLGLLVRRLSGVIDKHYLSSNNKTNVKFAATSLTDTQLGSANPEQYIESTVYDDQPTSLVRGLGGHITTSIAPAGVSTFDVGWGPWEGGAEILDSKGAPSVHVPEPVYWLSAKKADMADLTGTWTYGSNDGVTGRPNPVLGFFGEGTNGGPTLPLSELGMSFDVNFGLSTNNITNGKFEALVGGSDRWYTEFSGTANGPVASMASFSNATFGTNMDYSLNPGASLTGEIRGIFTGTGTTQGFATGFSLHDLGSNATLRGVGLIGNRTGP